MFRRLGHHAWCLRILDGLRFGRHRGAIDAKGTRASIVRSDSIEGRDVLEPFRLLRGLIEDGGLLGKLLYPLSGERLAWARRSERITVDGAVGRIRRRGGEGGGGGGACHWEVDGDRICDRRGGRDGRLRARTEERSGQARASRGQVGWRWRVGSDASGELIEGRETPCRGSSFCFGDFWTRWRGSG